MKCTPHNERLVRGSARLKARFTLEALCLRLSFELSALSLELQPINYLPQGPRDRSSLRFALCALPVVFPNNRYTADIHGRETAQIMGQSELGIFDLTFSGLAVKLKIHFIQHS